MRASQIAIVIISKILWVAAAVGACYGVVHFGRGARALLAPQAAASAGLACAVAIIPYVLARAWDEFTRRP